MEFSRQYLEETSQIAQSIRTAEIASIVAILKKVKSNRGRVFFLGVGGSAANASHAVNDFRKLAEIESYAPTDNVAELTARVNDNGWENVFTTWLKTSRAGSNDCLFILSVGGGDRKKEVSVNLCEAIDFGKGAGCKIVGIVGRIEGYTRQVADACIVVPSINPSMVTPHSESFQSIILHLLVMHPELNSCQTTW